MVDTIRRYGEPGGLAIVIVAAGAFFIFTNPKTTAAPLLVVGFLLLFSVILISLRLLLQYSGLSRKLPPAGRALMTWGFSMLAVVFLALQSIGQLTLRDVVMVLAVFATVSFYVLKVAGRR